LPDIQEIALKLRDSSTLEVDLDKSRSLNYLFEILSKYNIRVLSMRNKTNRLEELFIRLTSNNNDNAESINDTKTIQNEVTA